MLGLTAIFRFIKGTWKIWLPVIIVIAAAGTIWAQQNRIDTLKNQRDVAITQHDQAMEEQKQLLADIDRLNEILLRQRQVEKKLEDDLEKAKNRIRRLAEARPDVADWRNSALPAGLWQAVSGAGTQGGDSVSPDAAGRRPSGSSDNQR